MVILLMFLKVRSEFVDSFRQQRNLHLGRTGISFMGPKSADKFRFLNFIETQFTYLFNNLPAFPNGTLTGLLTSLLFIYNRYFYYACTAKCGNTNLLQLIMQAITIVAVLRQRLGIEGVAPDDGLLPH